MNELLGFIGVNKWCCCFNLWAFIPRNREKLSNLIKDSRIDNFSIDIEWDDSKIILFTIIGKS